MRRKRFRLLHPSDVKQEAPDTGEDPGLPDTVRCVLIVARTPRVRRYMSIKIMSWVWENSPYSGKQLLIHLALADFCNDDGICWPNQETVAKKARCTVETVRTATRQMTQDGLLEIIRPSSGPGSSHQYKLLPPKSFGVKGKEIPQIEQPIPQIQRPNTPNPSPNNRQEPSIEPKCPYCNTKFGNKTYHDCSAMNMRIRRQS